MPSMSVSRIEYSIGRDGTPIYEGWVTIKESVVHWRFPASDIKEAKIRLQEEIDRMVEDNVKAGVVQVKKP